VADKSRLSKPEDKKGKKSETEIRGSVYNKGRVGISISGFLFFFFVRARNGKKKKNGGRLTTTVL